MISSLPYIPYISRITFGIPLLLFLAVWLRTPIVFAEASPAEPGESPPAAGSQNQPDPGDGDCAALREQIKALHAALESFDDLSDAKRDELRHLLDVACSKQFRHCQFTNCPGNSTDTEDVEGGSTKDGDSLEDEAFNENPSEHDLEGMDQANQLKVPWLKRDWDCAALTEQIKARYAPLGSFDELSDAKRDELRYVLDVACSERFSHCQFTNCPGNSTDTEDVEGGSTKDGDLLEDEPLGDEPADVVPLTQKVDNLRAQEERELMVQALHAKRRQAISDARSLEYAEKRYWRIFTVPGDSSAPAKKPEVKKEETESKPTNTRYRRRRTGD